jgi:ABC-type antimicrobial peptide transport system permease subunit
LNWVVRTSGAHEGLAAAIRREITTTTGLPAAEMIPIGQLVASSLARQRFSMVLLGIFAVLALVLGAMGLYGVIAYSVAQRTREIGIRCALGAAPVDLMRLVLRDGMRLVIVGLAMGLAASVWLSRFARAILYGVSPTDPMILSAVAVALAATAALACLVPARRAALLDPVQSLRSE